MGEVVDDTLKVKAVNNLRVVDASVFPGHVVSSHTEVGLHEREVSSDPYAVRQHHEHDIRCVRKGSGFDQGGRWEVPHESRFWHLSEIWPKMVLA